jgi:hypothetical protein
MQSSWRPCPVLTGGSCTAMPTLYEHSAAHGPVDLHRSGKPGHGVAFDQHMGELVANTSRDGCPRGRPHVRRARHAARSGVRRRQREDPPEPGARWDTLPKARACSAPANAVHAFTSADSEDQEPPHCPARDDPLRADARQPRGGQQIAPSRGAERRACELAPVGSVGRRDRKSLE